jgi:signal transduction histidine kinase
MADLPEGRVPSQRESALKREVLVASLLFAAMFFSVAGLGTSLIIRDLGKKETSRLLQTYTTELRELIARIPTTETKKGFLQQTVVTTRLNEFAAEKKFFDSMEIYDDQGNLVYRDDKLRGGQILAGDLHVLGLAPGQQRVETKNRIPIEVPVPIEPGKMGKAVLSVSEAVLEKQAQEFRRELVTKLVGMVGLICLMVALAYLYVLRVIRLSRRIEKEAQNQLRLSYLGLLSSGIAHEIKNPINSIHMNLQMLEEEVSQGAGPEEIRSWLDPIRREIRRLERLVNDFLLYAKPLTPRLETVSLPRLLEDLARLVAEEARAQGVALAVEASPDLPAPETDEGLLRTALLNLVLNAVQASPPGSRVLLRALPGEKAVILEVQDQGEGIPPENRERVFDIFFTTRKGGTGLGLPIARRLAETLGGDLSLAPCEGKGACFRLTLPLSEKGRGTS